MVIWVEDKQSLIEKLELATRQQFNLLQKQIDKDPETKRMLMSPMEDIPQYRWLYSDEHDNTKYICLFLALKGLFASGKITIHFSKTGGTFTGFVSYKENGTEIKAIKMASFKDDKNKTNPVLAMDLIRFLEAEIKKRTKIEWKTDKQNSYANDQYVSLLNKRNFIWNRNDYEFGRMWIYTITGKK